MPRRASYPAKPGKSSVHSLRSILPAKEAYPSTASRTDNRSTGRPTNTGQGNAENGAPLDRRSRPSRTVPVPLAGAEVAGRCVDPASETSTAAHTSSSFDKCRDCRGLSRRVVIRSSYSSTDIGTSQAKPRIERRLCLPANRAQNRCASWWNRQPTHGSPTARTDSSHTLFRSSNYDPDCGIAPPLLRALQLPPQLRSSPQSCARPSEFGRAPAQTVPFGGQPSRACALRRRPERRAS